MFEEDGHAFQITYQGGDGNDLALTKLGPIQSWRFHHFGSIHNTGAGADLADTDGDGVSNLVEYALAMNVAVPAPVASAAMKVGGNLEFVYPRSKTATDVTCIVEWSDDLRTWSTAGVTSSVLAEGAATQQIKSLAPAGPVRRFMRLKVSQP